MPLSVLRVISGSMTLHELLLRVLEALRDEVGGLELGDRVLGRPGHGGLEREHLKQPYEREEARMSYLGVGSAARGGSGF